MSQKFENAKELIGSEMGMYDSATGETVIADKCIDLTGFCPKSKQVIVKYANVKRGRVAQIINLYEKCDDIGVCVHYHINELTKESLAKDSVFENLSSSLGCSSLLLAKLIFAKS